MPVMDGYEATLRIREAEAPTGMRVPIFALTAHAVSSVREQCIQCGMDEFITKPITPDVLRQALKRVTDSSDASEATEAGTAADTVSFVDPDQLVERMGNDIDGLIELIDLFLQSAPDYLHSLEEAVTGQDCEQIAIAAHALKGQVAFFTASRPLDAVREVEKSARDDDIAIAESALAELHECWPAFTEELGQLRNPDEKFPTSVTPTAP